MREAPICFLGRMKVSAIRHYPESAARRSARVIKPSAKIYWSRGTAPTIYGTNVEMMVYVLRRWDSSTVSVDKVVDKVVINFKKRLNLNELQQIA